MKTFLKRILQSPRIKSDKSTGTPAIHTSNLLQSSLFIEEFQIEINSFFLKNSNLNLLLEQISEDSIQRFLDEILYHSMDLQMKLTKQSLSIEEQSHKDFVTAVSWHIADSMVDIPFTTPLTSSGVAEANTKDKQLNFIKYFLSFQKAFEQILQTYNAFPEPLHFHSYEDYIESIKLLALKSTA